MVLGFTLSPFAAVRAVIESWRPRACNTEREYESALVAKLEKELKNQKIQRQFGHGSQKIDIVVDKKVAIEIKKDLKSTSSEQRLKGQLDQYLEDWDRLFIVLCGEVRSDLLKSVKDYVAKRRRMFQDVEIVVKK